MTTSDPAILYCRFIDSVINHRRLDHLDQFLAAGVVEHAPEATVGIEPARQRLAQWLVAFPDLHLVIEDLVVEGDHLMARLTATGTYCGRRAGLAATGGQVRVSIFEAWSVPDGRCAERWLQVGSCQLLHQLGLPFNAPVGWQRPPTTG